MASKWISALVCLGSAMFAPAASAAPDVTGFSGLVDGGFIYARVRADGAVLDSDQYVGQGDLPAKPPTPAENPTVDTEQAPQ